MSMTLFLQALDVWLFRDGRPFDAGSAHRAESIFPPYPSVMQGAIRTHRLLASGVDLKDEKAIADLVGGPDEYGSLRLRGPFLAKREGTQITRYFPQPADAILQDDKILPARLEEPSKFLKTNSRLPHVLGLKQDLGKPSSRPVWVSENALLAYLNGETVESIPEERLFSRDERIGIGMDERRVTVDGMLYEAEFIRPAEDVGLLVEMDGYDESEWNRGGILHLGGEGRMATFEAIQFQPPPITHKPSGRFKLYFSTPSYLANGWLPSEDLDDWSRFFVGPVKLIGAALQRYEIMGGFNWAAKDSDARAHRPSRRFVPAGSVYYFEGKPELQPGLIQQAITDFGAEIGFGQTIIKEW